jgi:hypoxanthine phosphoribosyltransferase
MKAAPAYGREDVLFAEAEIARRVKAIAREIAARPERPDIAVPILAGAFVFAADLLRALARENLNLDTEFIWLRSYGRKQTADDVKVLKAPGEIVRGRTVLLIDGVLDRGATMVRAKQLLDRAGAGAVISAVAVVKSCGNPLFAADHTLFNAGPEFLFGYGMDRDGLARGLPDIRVSRKEPN